MAGRGARDLSVGAFAALALTVLAVGIMAVGGESGVFSRKTHYRVTFPNAEGLRVGSPVMIAGVQVGAVTGVRLPTDPGADGIEVVLGVGREWSPRVRAGSVATLRYLQWLSGDRYVEVTAGAGGAEALLDGARLPVVQGDELFQRGAEVADNLNEVTLALRDILAPIRRGEGILGKLVRDPDFGREAVEDLSATLKSLRGLSESLRRGEGLGGRLLFDPRFAARADDLDRAIRQIASAADRLDRGEGALGDLLKKDGRAEAAVASFRRTVDSLGRSAEALETGTGILGRLIHDEEYGRRLAEDLETTLRNLAEISGKINSGQGTLGALVNDRDLHDRLDEVVSGVENSRFARWLLRHYRKKGIEASEKGGTPRP